MQKGASSFELTRTSTEFNPALLKTSRVFRVGHDDRVILKWTWYIMMMVAVCRLIFTQFFVYLFINYCVCLVNWVEVAKHIKAGTDVSRGVWYWLLQLRIIYATWQSSRERNKMLQKISIWFLIDNYLFFFQTYFFPFNILTIVTSTKL